MRITKEELRIPLRALFLLSLLALLPSIGLTLFLALGNYIGFNLTPSPASLCNSYQTTKFEANNTYIYSISFVASLLSNATTLALFLFLLAEVVKHTKSILPAASPYNYFTFAKLSGLYILTSLASLFLSVCLGYYLSLAVEKGACLGSIASDWLVAVGLSGLSFILALAMWIVVLWLINKHADQLGKEPAFN